VGYTEPLWGAECAELIFTKIDIVVGVESNFGFNILGVSVYQIHRGSYFPFSR